MKYLISVIITTYNWPDALSLCLHSLNSQHDNNFEIIIADDGSTQKTRDIINEFKQNTSIIIQHIFQEDLGFRAGTIRNKATSSSKGDYLIFLDGDCIVQPNFISRHRQLAEKGFWIPGNRILLSQSYTSEILDSNIFLHKQPTIFFLSQWLKGNINRILPLLHIPINFFRYLNPRKWQKAMTCNLAVWKSDFIAVNGFDEQFEGWGYEDSDLVIRLIHLGINRKEGRFAVPVLHLWHKQNDRSQHDSNYQRLMDRLKNPLFIRAEKGIDQYL